MKNTIQNEKGFTLIELVLCICILGLLAAAVTPSFGNLLAKSEETSGKGTAGAIQSAINVKSGENAINNIAPLYPTALDTAGAGTCSSSNECFSGVAQPLTIPQWSKVSDTEYKYDTTSVHQTYNYDTATGKFECSSGC